VSPFDGNNTQSGFTLLELLVSIVLIGLIVGIVGASMRLGYRSLDKGERRSYQSGLGIAKLMDAQYNQGTKPTGATMDETNHISSKGRRILSGSRQIIHSWAGREDMGLQG
jgi:prepilin-type N-terminal cleavage/methylation domain-containing protein